ncbi:SMI1/KNR4 family protein [Methylobacterium sp. Leaf118]|uniref:SMI1/KNR4 family protein n=1 Tax=Methylobacterium sp. Leaf118 TaxID=2876562 RepID=UPI001E2F0923|nr:SMI1/KNR4 family protein [Methylobacterium sp. Leaf118]
MATTDPSALAAELGRLVDAVAADADVARTGGDSLRLRARLDRAWDGAKPGAPLDPETSAALRQRREAVHDRLTARFVVLRDRIPEPEPLVLIDPDGPTLASFFTAPAAADGTAEAEAAIQAAETRLGVTLPATLKDLYRRRNDGATNFVLATESADAPLRFEGDDAVRAADALWQTVLPGFGLVAQERLETLGAIRDGIDFGGDEDKSWRAVLPGIDRLIPISAHGSDLFLCLNDVAPSAGPSVVLFDATATDGGPGRITFRCPDFACFCAGLRRPGITVEDGVALRGSRLLGDEA